MTDLEINEAIAWMAELEHNTRLYAYLPKKTAA